ncbi:VOC family protein [Thioclava sp. GXIMD4216]|uniref:VOC family protein n=1 Tax=Thioclava litoralis TaxID=3076557 RepID=A0ABZ1E409_9RHOB|nr:VOC family protein [Thioclava sp. FTW29]
MTQTTLFLYVADIARSCTFYEAAFGQAPLERMDQFALFKLPDGQALGLWQKDHVTPAATGAAGGCEIGFKLAQGEVDTQFDQWKALGPVLMEPTDLPFGRSFVIADPDGHRLRPYAMG